MLTGMDKHMPIEVGDFIRVIAWNVEGQVTAIRPPWMGSEDAVEVLLQERPDGPERRYTLEPSEYVQL